MLLNFFKCFHFSQFCLSLCQLCSSLFEFVFEIVQVVGHFGSHGSGTNWKNAGQLGKKYLGKTIKKQNGQHFPLFNHLKGGVWRRSPGDEKVIGTP